MGLLCSARPQPGRAGRPTDVTKAERSQNTGPRNKSTRNVCLFVLRQWRGDLQREGSGSTGELALRFYQVYASLQGCYGYSFRR